MLKNLARGVVSGAAFVAMAFQLVGCTGETGENGKSGAIRTTNESAGAHCEHGGLKVETGIDLNGNATLDDPEVLGTEYVCNQRIDGKTSLVDVKTENPGNNCEQGGLRVDFGLDDNDNKTLQTSEIDNTQYVCNGRNRLINILPLAVGTSCEQGGVEVVAGYDTDADGMLGTDEIDVRKSVCNGRSHMLKVDEVAIGGACPAGGIKVLTGFDTNGNQSLDSSEVQGTEYVCNGEDGKNTLVKFSNEPANPTGACFFGGTKMESGLDLNNNTTLDANEVISTRFVCSVQVNANMTLVKNSAVLPNTNGCTYGGVKIEVGIDDNDNQILETAEVDSTAIQCSNVIIVDGLTTLVTTAAATAAQCSFGGIIVRSGLDDNRNGILEVAEYDSANVVCNGANGFDAVTKSEAYSGNQCSSGTGFKFTSGLDTNRNGVLDTSEVKTTSYLCHGDKGDSGLNSLVKSVDAGTSCGSYGGFKIQVGVDDNKNNILDSAEVDGTGYACNGLNGLNALVSLNSTNSCGPNGGTRLDVGIDLDEDNKLDSNEVTAYTYICNGLDGLSMAVETDEDYWSSCGGAWGVRIRTGLDLDEDGFLDSNEIQYENFVCELIQQ